MIYPEKTFKRKNGSAGKVVNFDLRDETGICRLVIWNDDIEQVKQLKQGTKVKIINGYTKQGFSGLEIHLGRWGLLEIEPKDEIKTPASTMSESSDCITGVLLKKEPTHAFFRDNGEFGFVATVTIRDGIQEKKLTLWGQSVKEIQQYKIGDTVHITGVSSKQVNGKTEIHVNGNSIIKRCS
jgi:replication factor A1